MSGCCTPAFRRIILSAFSWLSYNERVASSSNPSDMYQGKKSLSVLTLHIDYYEISRFCQYPRRCVNNVLGWATIHAFLNHSYFLFNITPSFDCMQASLHIVGMYSTTMYMCMYSTTRCCRRTTTLLTESRTCLLFQSWYQRLTVCEFNIIYI